MVVHSASRFMQRIGKKQTRLQCVLMLTRQNMCIQPSLTFKIWFMVLKYGLSKLHVFLATPQRLGAPPQQVTYRTYLEYVVAFYIFKGD